MLTAQPTLKARVQEILDRYYPVVDGVRYLDVNRLFYQWILDGIDPAAATVLDLGAGPTPPPERSLRGRVMRVIGADIDPAVLTNSGLDEAHVINGPHLPFPDCQFDAVYSDWTIEHLQEPLPLLREVRRVLKPGCSYWFRTTNRHHYVTAVSAHTPHWFHRLVANRARALPSNSHDPWKAFYRMNTRRVIRRQAVLAGFSDVEVRTLEPHPVYLVFHPLAFQLGVAYERLVNRHRRLAEYRLIILARAEKSPSR